MGLFDKFDKIVDKVGDALKDVDPTSSDSLVRRGFRVVDPTRLPDVVRELDPSGEMERIAMPLAQDWKEDNPDAKPGSQADYDDCVLIVAAGVAAAATAIGGTTGGPKGAVIGAALGAGGGYAAARMACRRVLHSPSSSSSLSSEPDLIIKDGLLIKGSEHPHYIIKAGMRTWIPSANIFNGMGLDWNAVLTVKDNVLKTIPQGEFLFKGSDHPIYIFQGGKRRWIPSMDTFNKMGLNWNAVFNLKDSVVSGIPEGDAMPTL